YGQTPVLWAASRGRSDVVRYLAEKNADLNQQSGNNAPRSSSGYTPLHWACKNGHTKTIKVLLEKNANIEARDRENQTPTDVSMKHTRYIRELNLLNYLAKVNRRQDDDFYYKFRIFGHTFNWSLFGACSAKEKKGAANALKEVVFD